MVCSTCVCREKRKGSAFQLKKIPLLQKGADYTPSKWIHLTFFISEKEWEVLLSQFPELLLFSLKNPQKESEIIKDNAFFLSAYKEDVQKFLKGEKLSCYKDIFPFALTADPSDLGLKRVDGDRVLVSIRKPLLLVRPHFFSLSQIDKKITKGKNIFWGTQLSYPLVYIDPDTHEIQEGMKAKNGAIFKAIRKWLRKNTHYVSILSNQEKIECPYRISREIYRSIQEMPGSPLQLGERAIEN